VQILNKLRCIFNRDTKIKLVVLVIAIIIGALLETLALSLISPFISILLDPSMIDSNRFVEFAYDLLGFSSTGAFLALLTFLLAGVYIFRGVYLYAVSKLQYRFIARRQADLSGKLLRKILEYPYLYHSKKNLAELQRIIVTDVQQMFVLITSILLLLTDLFMTLFIVIFLVIVSPVMTLCVCVMAALCVLLYLKAFRKQVRAAGDKSRDAQIGMNKAVNQALGGIKEVKVLRREGFFYNTFKDSSDIYVKYFTQFRTFDSVPKLVIESVCFGGAFIIIGVLIIGGADIAALVPQLSLFVLAAFRLLPAVSRQVNMLNQVVYYRSSVDAVYKSLFEDDDTAIEAVIPVTELPADVLDIIVSDVTFQYPNTPSPVLKDISLTIPDKKSVAFIGASGEGKTTLADIILGVLTPETGGVFFAGKSIHHSFEEWSRNVGYIPQQIYLLDESILENVAFGIERDDIDVEQVWHTLEQAQLASFVRSLPEGLETIVGDRGIRLSGGQRQRIGIARALYNNPSILVLDEATSSLDTETEKAVMEAIEKFQGDKTMIIIAHRLSTIENCDIIYRVEDGDVVREK